MAQGAAAFLSGILFFQQLPSLPSLFWLAAGAVLASLSRRLRLPRVVLWCAGGFLWALLQSHYILLHALPVELEGVDILAEGVVATIPERQGRLTRFDFDVATLAHDGQTLSFPVRIRLSWYDGAPPLVAGEHWRLKVRLKRPHGFANPGGFDYEGWLYRKRIRATGYVRADLSNQRIEQSNTRRPLERLRQRLGENIMAALPAQELSGVIVALAIGDYQHIDRGQWEVFRRTGTTHLVAISGLHVGMVAALLFVVVRRSWGWAGRAALHWPAQHAGAVAAMLAALSYSALAGFAVPTQRSLVMIVAVMAALLLRRGQALLRAFAIALLLVLLYDPLAVMDGGFWLSFGAVAAILFGMGARSGANGWWWRWGRVHMLVTVALAPPLLLLFQEFPLASPLANFVAVPWISLVVVPLVLIGAALLMPLPVLGGAVLKLAEWLLALLWPALDAVAAVDWAQWSQHAPYGWTLAAALLGTALMLAPRGVPGRWLGVLWLLPAVALTPPKPAPGEAWLTLLDVGQGLAAVVRTHQHVLVYDTGARFSPDFDAGSAVVLPYLRSQGLRLVDTLLISHGDNDHAGGADALLRWIGVRRLVASAGAMPAVERVEECVEGMAWTWDAVRFEIIHPAADNSLKRNDASCVLRVRVGGTVMLLPGDIEARVEARLLASGHDLAAQILVAPHHGSRSSSTLPFVRAVAPRYVLFPVGYRNRWGFPHEAVRARYRDVGAVAFDSARHGAVTIRVSSSGVTTSPETYRQVRRRYWHED